MPVPRWSRHLQAGEQVLLTVHAKGVPDVNEINGSRYQVHYLSGAFKGFLDPSTMQVYSASGLCKAKLRRSGAKDTQEWCGPKHCLVLRGGVWVPLQSLN